MPEPTVTHAPITFPPEIVNAVTAMLVQASAYLDNIGEMLIEEYELQPLPELVANVSKPGFLIECRDRYTEMAMEVLGQRSFLQVPQQSLELIIGDKVRHIVKSVRARAKAGQLKEKALYSTAKSLPSEDTYAERRREFLESTLRDIALQHFPDRRAEVTYMLQHAVKEFRGFPAVYNEATNKWEELPDYKTACRLLSISSHMDYIAHFFGRYLSRFNGGEGDFISQADLDVIIPSAFKCARNNFSKKNNGQVMSSVIPAKHG